MSSDVADSNGITIDICVCTFRRAKLADTLASLAKLNIDKSFRVRVIVADNDDTPSAQKIVETAQTNFPFPITYVHAPARNISVARNACLNAATATYIAFIDDDERAEPQWLSALIAQQKQSNADVVLGPVEAKYPSECPAWIRLGNFHAVKPVLVNDKIITGYTSNALFVRESPALLGLRFDPKWGRSGGEDTFFFSTIHKDGGIIDYAPNAIIIEYVSRSRLNFEWLARRSFRSGQTHGSLLLSEYGDTIKVRANNAGLALAKALYCLTAAILFLPMRKNVHSWLLRGTLHAGVVARMLGLSELVQYG